MKNTIKNKIIFGNEKIINQFEVEELENRLENKWGRLCPEGEDWNSNGYGCVSADEGPKTDVNQGTSVIT